MARFHNFQNFLDQLRVISVRMIRFKTCKRKLLLRRNMNCKIEAAWNDGIAGITARLEHVRVDSSARKELCDSG